MNYEAGAIKALVYLGVMLLVGGAVTGFWLAPGVVRAGNRRLFGALVVVGALVLVAGSYLDVVATLRQVLGRADADLVGRYLASTAHGAVTTRRAVLAPVLAVITLLALLPAARLALRLALGVAATGVAAWLLYGFSSLSHAAAMGGAVPLGADYVHLVAAAAWAGPLGYLALLPGWEGARAAAAAAFRRLSVTGLVAVIVLAVSGSFTALTHMDEPRMFATSAYGETLWVKLGLFALVLVVAAANRFRYLPRFLAGGSPAGLRGSVRIEALLVCLLILVTGALTTAALPHEGGAVRSALDNLLNLLGLLKH